MEKFYYDWANLGEACASVVPLLMNHIEETSEDNFSLVRSTGTSTSKMTYFVSSGCYTLAKSIKKIN